MLKTHWVLLILLMLSMMEKSALAAPGSNKILNFGCEDDGNPPANWTDVSGDVYCEDSMSLIGIPNADEGSFVFSSFLGTTHTAEQIFDGGTDLENCNFWYSFAYYDSTTGEDTGEVIYEFLNASDVVVGTLYDSGTLNPDDDQWHTVSGGPITAPANTQKIKVTLTCDEGASDFCDVFFDDFSLTGETPTAVTMSGYGASSSVYFVVAAFVGAGVFAGSVGLAIAHRRRRA